MATGGAAVGFGASRAQAMAAPAVAAATSNHSLSDRRLVIMHLSGVLM
jgi:hypothetical protein